MVILFLIYVCRFRLRLSSTSFPGGNQVDGSPPASSSRSSSFRGCRHPGIILIIFIIIISSICGGRHPDICGGRHPDIVKTTARGQGRKAKHNGRRTNNSRQKQKVQGKEQRVKWRKATTKSKSSE